jgi:hypothetical protein
MKAKKLAQKPFSNPSSAPREVQVILGTKGSRTIRSRGGVIIDVRSGGQQRSIRLDAH